MSREVIEGGENGPIVWRVPRNTLRGSASKHYPNKTRRPELTGKITEKMCSPEIWMGNIIKSGPRGERKSTFLPPSRLIHDNTDFSRLKNKKSVQRQIGQGGCANWSKSAPGHGSLSLANLILDAKDAINETRRFDQTYFLRHSLREVI